MNELQEILKRIKFLSNKNIGEIAIELGFKSRAYFNDQVNKGSNDEIKNRMLDYERELKQSVSTDLILNEGKNLYMASSKYNSKDDYQTKYIHLLERQVENDKTEIEKLNERLGNMEANLNVLIKSQKVLYSNLLGFQEEILNHLSTNERARRAALLSAHIRTNNHLEKVEKEGIPFGGNN